MLSKTHFDRETITIYQGTHYEVIRPRGHPMVLFHGTTGAPIAALHVGCANDTALITARAPGVFQGIVSQGDTHVFLVLTNLLFHETIVMNVNRGEALVNEINVLRPGESVRVSGDFSEGNRKIFLDALKKGEHNVTDGPKGAHLLVTVFPQKGPLSLVGSMWSCPELLCRPRAPAERGSPSYQPPPARIGDAGPVHGEWGPDECIGDAPAAIDYEAGSTPVTLILSVMAPDAFSLQRPPSKASMLGRALDLTRDCIIHKNEQLVRSLKAVYVCEECVVCLEGVPDVVLAPCGHCCVHGACWREEEAALCPMCRAPVQAKIHV